MQIIIAILLCLSLSSRAVTEEQKTIEILTYPIPGNPPWDPGSINQGIPGSEEAVIYISQKLADLGYKILVKGNPPADSLHSLPDANPRFVAVDYDDGIKRDIGIAWRTPTMVRELKNRTKKVYLWPHDIDYYSDVTDKDIDGYADVLWLSEWERQNWIARHPGFEKFNKIFGNGINPEQFQPVQERSNPYSCIYGSNYGRGLEILLDIWPKIKNSFLRPRSIFTLAGHIGGYYPLNKN